MILGISEAPQDISFEAMAERQQALGPRHSQGPGGRKPVVLHRHRRHQHDAQQRADPDQPEAARRAQCRRQRASSAGCKPQLDEVEGITLFMQPVQDLTVETRVSRTQYQYSLEDPDAEELGEWVPKFVDELETLPRAARRGQRPAERGTADPAW